MMAKIKRIKAREILDSRGKPTVEVKLKTDAGTFLASVPSGTSRGRYEAEALEAMEAVSNINDVIGPKLKGADVASQKEIDETMLELDGTSNKSRLGANAILSVSLALCRAGAAAQNLSLYKYIRAISNFQPAPYQAEHFGAGFPISKLPQPAILMLEGGKHGSGGLATQEFMLVPQAKSFKEKFELAKKVYQALLSILREKYGRSGVTTGLEAGFTPPVKRSHEALELLMAAVGRARLLDKIKIMLDVAASSFFKDGQYHFEENIFGSSELLDFYSGLLGQYPIFALEDPFSQDDWEGWRMLMSNVKCRMSHFLVIGDDLTVTNPERIKMAKEKELCQGVVIKPNQIGTISETLEAVKLAKSFGWKIIVSHRSGETTDDFIADLAVGIDADFIKAGAPARPERMAKYNRLLKIEEEEFARPS